MPTFSNFTPSPLVSGAVTVSWVLDNPGLKPLSLLILRWTEYSPNHTVEDLSDPSSSVYPVGNILILEYDTRNSSSVLGRGDTFEQELSGLETGRSYVVAVTGTSVLGSQTTLFEFTAGIPYTF